MRVVLLSAAFQNPSVLPDFKVDVSLGNTKWCDNSQLQCDFLIFLHSKIILCLLKWSELCWNFFLCLGMLDIFSWNLKSVETSWILPCWRWMPNNFMAAIPVTWCLPDTKQIWLVFWPISFREFSRLEDVDLKLRGRTFFKEIQRQTNLRRTQTWPDSCASTET